MTEPAALSIAALAERVRGLTRWRALGLAALGGAVANLAFAPFHLVPVLAASLTLFVWLIDGATKRPDPGRAALARGFAFGFGFFAAGVHWVGSAFLQVEGAAPLLAPAVAALGAALALFWAAAARAMLLVWTDDWRRIPAFAVALAGAEWLRGVLFTGFPWNLLGMAWPAGGSVSQLAALVGVYGLTLFTVLICASAATLGDRGHGFGRRAAPLIAAALALGVVWGAGVQRLAATPLEPATWTGPIVRTVDVGFSQMDQWKPGAGEAMFARFLELSATEESRAEVVVWPEGALPLFLLERPDMLQAIGARLGNRVLLTGLTRAERGADGPRIYNSLAVLDSVRGELRLGQIYDKHHLVPFGEYIPFWSLFSAVPIAPLQQIGAGFTPGRPPERLIVPGAPPAGPLICYEAIFPGYVPRGEERPDWIVNVSIDSWYGRSTGPWQHANQARYRAIEEGLPLVRAASGGVSGVFDALGREVVAVDLNGGAVESTLPPPIPETLYARYGALLTPLMFIFIAALRITRTWGARGRRP